MRIAKALSFNLIFICTTVSTHVTANGVAPYLPIHSSPALDNEIERLASIANIPNLTKPYNVATIYHYMEKVKSTHPTLYKRLNKALKSYEKTWGLTYKKLTVSTNNNIHTKPNNDGVDTEQHYQSIIRGQWQVTDWFAIYGGGNITKDEQQLTGSTLSIGTNWAQLDIGYKEHWFGPFNGSGQLISNNAQTMPSVSLSNNLPISIYGHNVNYELFLAQMSTQPVLFEGSFSNTKNPYLAGMHISFQPTPWWTLGANRMFQFSGGERPIDVGKVIDAFFDPRGTDNTADLDDQSGNQIASITSKINFDTSIPVTLNVEYAGEDTANSIEGQLGNSALITGIYFPYLFNDVLSLNYEYSNWQTSWYTNGVYGDGYVNEDYVVGHWALQPQRENGTATEGSSHYLNSVWQINNNHVISASVRTSKNQNTSEQEYKDTWEVNINYTMPFYNSALSLEVYTGIDYLGEEYAQAGLSLQW